MLVETVLAILVVSVITSAALSLFSSVLLNLNVQKLATEVQMCEISQSGDHLGFSYTEEEDSGRLVKKIGPISESAEIVAKALRKIQEKYSDCKFTNTDNQEIDFSVHGKNKITGYFYIGPKISSKASYSPVS